MYLGILEEQKKNNVQVPLNAILYLLGTDYLDYSPYNHPVNVVGNVPINNGAYYFDGNPNNYISIPNHPIFQFVNRKYEFSVEFMPDTPYNTSGVNMFFSMAQYNLLTNPNNHIFLYFNTVNNPPRLTRGAGFLSTSNNSYDTATANNTPPNQNYLTSFQKAAIQFNNLNGTFRNVNTLYNGGNLGVSGFASTVNFNNSTYPIVIGRDVIATNSAYRGWIKNVLIVEQFS